MQNPTPLVDMDDDDYMPAWLLDLVNHSYKDEEAEEEIELEYPDSPPYDPDCDYSPFPGVNVTLPYPVDFVNVDGVAHSIEEIVMWKNFYEKNKK